MLLQSFIKGTVLHVAGEIPGEKNGEIPAMLVPPCVQNIPGKNGELNPSGYSL